MSDNKLSGNKLSNKIFASELVENREFFFFLNQSQSRTFLINDVRVSLVGPGS